MVAYLQCALFAFVASAPGARIEKTGRHLRNGELTTLAVHSAAGTTYFAADSNKGAHACTAAQQAPLMAAARAAAANMIGGGGGAGQQLRLLVLASACPAHTHLSDGRLLDYVAQDLAANFSLSEFRDLSPTPLDFAARVGCGWSRRPHPTSAPPHCTGPAAAYLRTVRYDNLTAASDKASEQIPEEDGTPQSYGRRALDIARGLAGLAVADSSGGGDDVGRGDAGRGGGTAASLGVLLQAPAAHFPRILARRPRAIATARATRADSLLGSPPHQTGRQALQRHRQASIATGDGGGGAAVAEGTEGEEEEEATYDRSPRRAGDYDAMRLGLAEWLHASLARPSGVAFQALQLVFSKRSAEELMRTRGLAGGALSRRQAPSAASAGDKLRAAFDVARRCERADDVHGCLRNPQTLAGATAFAQRCEGHPASDVVDSDAAAGGAGGGDAGGAAEIWWAAKLDAEAAAAAAVPLLAVHTAMASLGPNSHRGLHLSGSTMKFDCWHLCQSRGTFDPYVRMLLRLLRDKGW